MRASGAATQRTVSGRRCSSCSNATNGADVVTRLEYEDTMPAPQLLRLVKHVEDILDDFAADTGEFSTWLTSHRGEPWRGVVWEGASGR